MIKLNNNNISSVKLGDSDVKLYLGSAELYTPILIIDGYEAVDLGLPSGTKWAKVNIGATSETDYGNYYMWGKGATTYNSSDEQYNGSEDPLSLENDTARQVWGGEWHMPTQAQAQELIDYTTNEWTSINNITGVKFTAQNGNYIFLPAAGLYGNGSPIAIGSSCGYWCANSGENIYAKVLQYISSPEVGRSYRTGGYPVRGVIG